MTKSILITIDLEDWFQVENLRSMIDKTTWDQQELRVVQNTEKLLELFDSFPFKVKTTFFVLGWVAERVPDLIKEIKNKGHEIASHGYGHNLCSEYTEHEFIDDITKAKTLLEHITGEEVLGYRAPNFSIDRHYLELVNSCGYLYDSSFNSFAGHGRYGKLNLAELVKKGVSYQVNETFFELPLSNLRVKGKVIPWAGGGYFRLYPTPIFQYGVRKILKTDEVFHFYLHPWEVDHKQPRIDGLPSGHRFRHYVNLKHTEKKLKQFIQSFHDCRFITCSDYLHNIQC